MVNKTEKQNCCWNCEHQDHYGYGLHRCKSKNKDANYYKHKNIWDLYNKTDCVGFKLISEVK